MKKYKNLTELREAIDAGEIDESQLRIVLDNDCTQFGLCPEATEEGDEIEENRIEVESSGGYQDIEELYALLFPKALVEWC